MFNCKVYERSELGTVNGAQKIELLREPTTNGATIVVGTSSIRMMDRRQRRHSLTIQNVGAAVAYLSFGVPAVPGSGFTLSAGGGSFFSDANFPPQGDVYIIADADTDISFVEVYT